MRARHGCARAPLSAPEYGPSQRLLEERLANRDFLSPRPLQQRDDRLQWRRGVDPLR